MNNLEDKVIHVSSWIGSVASLIFHTLIFVSCFVAILLGADFEKVLLSLTTIVSLEAIYLSIFIQMSVNRNQKVLEAAQHEIKEISVDIDEIQEDVHEIEKDIDEIQEDVEEINEDVDKIEKDIDEIQEDVEEISEDVDKK